MGFLGPEQQPLTVNDPVRGLDFIEPAGESAHHVRAAPAVQVQQVRPLAPQQSPQPPGKAQVKVTAHLEGVHARHARGRLRERAARVAQQHVVVPQRRQALHQVLHLERTAVQVTAGFDVNDLHASNASDGMARSTSSTPMPPRHGCAPAQLGERLQGAHGRPR